MNKHTVKTRDFSFKNGALTFQAQEPLSASIEEEKPKAKAKTDAERQKDLYERRKAEGWRKIWVDPKTLELAKMLGGIENIPADREAWIARVKEQEKRRPWWRFWR